MAKRKATPTDLDYELVTEEPEDDEQVTCPELYVLPEEVHERFKKAVAAKRKGWKGLLKDAKKYAEQQERMQKHLNATLNSIIDALDNIDTYDDEAMNMRRRAIATQRRYLNQLSFTSLRTHASMHMNVEEIDGTDERFDEEDAERMIEGIIDRMYPAVW